MSTDPWCKKCPFQMECIQYSIRPQSMSCEVLRLDAGHLNEEDTWLVEVEKDLMKLVDFLTAPLGSM